MTPSEAFLAKETGIKETAKRLISEIEARWDKRLGTGRDNMWVQELDGQVEEVRDLVAGHFLKLGYGFEKEACNGYAGPHEVYHMRLVPYVKEPGIMRQLFTRLFGGSHA